MVILLMSLSSEVWSQTRKYAKLQKSLSWEQYEKTWFKKAISNLKEAKKDTKNSVKETKSSKKRRSKLTKYREQISAIAARKEESHE